MNWRIKSQIQRCCSTLPGGGTLYAGLQRTLGRHRRPDYGDRLELAARIADRLAGDGGPLIGATVVEVGTGYAPFLPTALWLAGADRVETFDLHRHLRPALAAGMLRWIVAHRERVAEKLAIAVDREILDDRLALLTSLRDRPLAFLDRAGIAYRAPADAAATGLAEGSVDLHVSAYVFEHVPPGAIAAILREAGRVLRPGGTAFHRVDPTDHYAHADPTITTVNFLRFDESEWRHHGAGRYAYHNRLRDADYRRLIAESPLALAHHRYEVDARAVAALRDGFPLASPYRDRDAEELARCRLDFIARKPARSNNAA